MGTKSIGKRAEIHPASPRGVGVFFPEQWARFRDGVPEAEITGNLIGAYHRLLMNPDPAIHEKAARDWCDWEMALVAVHPNHAPHPRYEKSAFRLAFARIVTHYWCHNAWLEDGILLREANRLSGIPGVLIHGRLDLGGPLVTPWRLAQHWPGSELVIVSEAGARCEGSRHERRGSRRYGSLCGRRQQNGLTLRPPIMGRIPPIKRQHPRCPLSVETPRETEVSHSTNKGPRGS
jgi:proline iminopeptidase